jgi:hypothetical protein
MRLFNVALLVLAIVGSATMVGVGRAHAAGDSDYLKLLNDYGFDVSTDQNRQLMLQLGHAMCNDLRRGAIPPKEAQMGLELGAASRVIMSAAQLDLCPETLPPQP